MKMSQNSVGVFFLYKFFIFPCIIKSFKSPSFWTHRCIMLSVLGFFFFFLEPYFQNFLNSMPILISYSALLYWYALGLFFTSFPVLNPHLTLTSLVLLLPISWSNPLF